MKKAIVILIVLTFVYFNSYCQKKDSTTYIDTTYRISLSKEEFISLINAIKSLDEKPSIINAWLQQNIYNKTQIIPPMKPKENDLTKKK